MAHQSSRYAHDHWRFSGACARVTPKAYLIQRFVNSQDTRVFAEIRHQAMTSIGREAKRQRWKKVPAGTYDRLILCAALEHACAGPGWSARQRARLCGLAVVEFRRYRARYEFIYGELLDWLNIGHRQILRTEIQNSLLDWQLTASC